MRWSKIFIPTLREETGGSRGAQSPAAPTGGLRTPVGRRRLCLSLPGAEVAVKDRTDHPRGDGCHRGRRSFYLPALNPAELWQESGRWDVMGDTMFRLNDRNQRSLCLALTHEEGMTDIARREIRSYRQLPQALVSDSGEIPR